jgi:2-hydroxychromene-2-carboxylate isomerase
MHRLDFWFDPISPYAALAFERLPQVLAGHGVTVSYRPILFAGLLKRWGQLGPAEVPPKRAWTYRHVAWLAREHGIELQMPRAHPFDPLPLLRLAWACATPAGAVLGTQADAVGVATPNRRVVEALMRHVWHGGLDPGDPDRLAALQADLAPALDPTCAAVKQALRAATDDAIARGVFGVPTIGCAGRLYWGLDGLAMLAATLGGASSALDDADWRAAADLPAGLQRPR